MDSRPAPSTPDPSTIHKLEDKLRAELGAEAMFDNLTRTNYASDASIYELVPIGVVRPTCVEDVVAATKACRDFGIPIVARGAGTGLTGGAVTHGVVVDLSRHMTEVGDLDVEARTVEVQPGVVLDQLNRVIAGAGLHFAPDVATSDRATLGGMIANNSCGAHSVIHGRTVDHVLELTVVLADGEVVTFKRDAVGQHRGAPSNDDRSRAAVIEQALARIRDDNFDEIQQRFPKVLRSNGGYGLDRLGARGTSAEAVKLLCGSEGTLGIVVGAKLALTPLPRHKALAVLHFDALLDALSVVPAALAHKPAAVELVDRMILAAARDNPTIRRRCGFLQGDPAALIVVEFFADDVAALASKVEALLSDDDARGTSYAGVAVLGREEQQDVWEVRKAGLGLLMSRPGDAQPYAFVEDTAVDPARLRDYIARFRDVLVREGAEAGYYAHASVGCLHVRPVLNLKSEADIQRMHRIADGISDLAIEFGGTMTGEHGDGIVRSGWLLKLYGPKIVAAFESVKRLFDPDGLMNPGKIVEPWSMTEHLRQGAGYAECNPSTWLGFSAHGGMAQLAGMCSGVGNCRQQLTATMCPSFMATSEERHTTRARAAALRSALSNRGLLTGLDDPALDEVMDLCLSCKACKTECPTGVDMAKLKAEYLSHRHLREGASRRARFVADMARLASRASRFPRVSNLVARSRPFRAWMERRYGLDRRIAPPALAHQTFREWFRRRRHAEATAAARHGRVVYFVDTWTNYYTPQVGIAAVKLLDWAGYEVCCPPTQCSGRPAISQGLLAEAKQLAETNVRLLSPFAVEGAAIVGTEPSCISALVDEYPQLFRTRSARRVASRSMMIESFLLRTLESESSAAALERPAGALVYHAHCHQKALVGSGDAVELLHRVWGPRATEIDSGCCGMAGSFGHEKEHYEVSRAVGEHRLFPAIRDRADADVAVSGFSCRQQIEHHTDAKPRHVVEYLASLLPTTREPQT